MHNAGIFGDPMTTAADPHSRVTAVVLAGGRGLRMGGVDKGLIERDGRCLVEHALEALRPQVAALMISANRNIERYSQFGVPVVTDELPDFAGPLSGIAAAASRARTDWIVCAPCDTPMLPFDLVARLLDGARRNGSEAAYAEDRNGPQFVVCLLHRRLASALATAAASPRRAVRDFLQARAAIAVRFDDWHCANLNTPEALAC
jgi:molybdopterin-guanine dinucleotide biosynthesis protein A